MTCVHGSRTTLHQLQLSEMAPRRSIILQSSRPRKPLVQVSEWRPNNYCESSWHSVLCDYTDLNLLFPEPGTGSHTAAAESGWVWRTHNWSGGGQVASFQAFKGSVNERCWCSPFFLYCPVAVQCRGDQIAVPLPLPGGGLGGQLRATAILYWTYGQGSIVVKFETLWVYRLL